MQTDIVIFEYRYKDYACHYSSDSHGSRNEKRITYKNIAFGIIPDVYPVLHKALKYSRKWAAVDREMVLTQYSRLA
jgi:hypothetical protein